MVSVITAPRLTEANYLPATLAALSKQLDAETIPLVTADACRPEIPPGWNLQSHPGRERRGSRRQMRAVMEAFITSDAERLLYCEDDTIPCRNLVQYARRVEIADNWPLLSLFDPRMWQKNEEGPIRRIVELPCQFFLFTQCFVVTRATVEKLLPFDFAAQPRRIKGPNGSDSMIRGFIAELGYKAYGVQIPNLVTHIGDDSIVVHGKTRVSEFGSVMSPGAAFDSLRLLPTTNRNKGTR